MNDLEKHLNRLLSFMKAWGGPPSCPNILFVEDTSVIRGMPSLIPRAALASQEEYAAKFDEHLQSGHSWINMSAAGILNGALLIAIELPKYKNHVPKENVSVNLSGQQS